MRIFRNTVVTLLLLVVGTFLHYTLPQHDVVRIVSSRVERQDLDNWKRIFWSSPDYQSGELINRDVQFIATKRQKTFLLGFIPRDGEEEMEYRNEDTSWSWPPYFKFDTHSLQTEAEDLISTSENPKWAVVTHYGWRIKLFSAFPNAVAIKAVDSPRPTVIPWFNIIFFSVLIALLLFIRAMWRQFRERTIDPALEDTRDAWDKVDENIDERRGRLSRWWRSWTGR